MAPLKYVFSSLAVAALVPFSGLVAQDASPIDASCAKIGSSLQVAVESAGSRARILQLVEDAMIASEECACEIVKSAIIGSKADQEFVGEIVRTAATSAPGMTPTIAECAMAVAPDAGGQIRLALEQVLVGEGAVDGGKTPVYDSATPETSYESTGKSVAYESYDKTPLPPQGPGIGENTGGGGTSFGDDFGKAPVDIRGIYLIPPAVGGFGGGTVVTDNSDLADRLAALDDAIANQGTVGDSGAAAAAAAARAAADQAAAAANAAANAANNANNAAGNAIGAVNNIPDQVTFVPPYSDPQIITIRR